MKKTDILPGYKLYTSKTVLLCAAGLLLNILLSRLVLALGIPLFIDNVGTITAAALGGPLPAMIVGFVTNVINSVSEPITLYYGILSIAIALLAAQLSKKGVLKTIKGCIFAALCFAVIGGAGGSVFTWILYGGGIGEGISAPYATAFASAGAAPFWAQLAADIVIDVADKLITMVPVYLFLHFYPAKLYDAFPLSCMYDRSEMERSVITEQKRLRFRRSSVNTKIVSLIIICLTLVSLISTTVSVIFYKNDQVDELGRAARNVSHTVSKMIDGNKIDEFLAEEEPSREYLQEKSKLTALLRDTEGLQHIYVYKVDGGGCHVVLDAETGYESGNERDRVSGFPSELLPYRDALIAGEDIGLVESNGSYGHLISSYSRIFDLSGKTTAYIGVDVSLDSLLPEMREYAIKLIAIQFGISIIIVAFAIWYAQKKLAQPITDIVELSRKFDETDPEEWLDSDAWKNRKPISGGDEIEELYNTVCKVETNVAVTITKMRENERRLMRSEELEKKNAELAEAKRRADEANLAKSDFLSRMSHDMRTPMNGILGLATLMRDEDDVGKMHEELEQILISGKYLLNLINDTLDMNKIEAGVLELKLAPLDGELLLNNILSSTKMLAQEKGVEVCVSLPKIEHGRWVPVTADASRIEQILMNLVSNAVKYTPRGGKIELIMETVKIDEQTVTDRYIVKDNGIGMSKEFMPHLFEPFAQEGRVDISVSHGTGLGMSIVKRLVDLMEGSIEVESEIDKGTTVTVVLQYQRYFGEMKTEEKPAEHEKLMGRRMLVVEDHPLNAEIMGRLLQKHGVTVDFAENGREGVNAFVSSAPGTYDVILMDVRMPVMDGIEATEAIRKSGRSDAQSIPIVAMTANAYDEDVKMCLKAGMNEHMAKPVEPEAMYKMLIRIMK